MVAYFKKHWRSVFEVASTVAVVALAGALVWDRGNRFPTSRSGSEMAATVPREPVSIGTAPVRGSLAASVALIEFADFECPACATFASEVGPALVREYVETGKVAFVFKHLPLPMHPTAKEVAEATWCAQQQGKFWEAHDWLYAEVDRPLETLARAIGLDQSVFGSCVQSLGPKESVETDLALGQALQLRGTPTFLIGRLLPDGRVRVTDAILGAHSAERFVGIFERLLAEASSAPLGRGGGEPQ